MKKNYYAVKRGAVPGIYTDWDSAKLQVTGFPGAQYKGFATEAEAKEYMGLSADDAGPAGCADPDVTEDPALTGSESTSETPVPDPGCAIAYVDGSFKESEGRFSYGIVMFVRKDGDEVSEIRLNKAFSNPELLEMRNVSGEIIGAAEAMKQAREMGLKKITIHHDYEGIAKWCLGLWKANKPWVKKYKAFYDTISQDIDIEFIKVKGHSGDRFNDLADSLAKDAFL